MVGRCEGTLHAAFDVQRQIWLRPLTDVPYEGLLIYPASSVILSDLGFIPIPATDSLIEGFSSPASFG